MMRAYKIIAFMLALCFAAVSLAHAGGHRGRMALEGPRTERWLAGLPGFEEIPETDTESGSQPAIPEELLIMKNFSSRRIDELLMNLRRAGVPRIALKAIVTESNSGWTLYELYTELKKEYEAMTVKTAASSLQTDAGPQKDR